MHLIHQESGIMAMCDNYTSPLQSDKHTTLLQYQETRKSSFPCLIHSDCSICSECTSDDDKVSPILSLRPHNDDEAKILLILINLHPAGWNSMGKTRGMNHTMDRMPRLLSPWDPTVLMMKMMLPLQLSNKTKRSLRRVRHGRKSPRHQRQWVLFDCWFNFYEILLYMFCCLYSFQTLNRYRELRCRFCFFVSLKTH